MTPWGKFEARGSKFEVSESVVASAVWPLRTSDFELRTSSSPYHGDATQNVSVLAMGLADQAGAHDVADAAADAGGGAAVGLEGAGVVVGFDLDGDAVDVVEADDAGVVVEDADEPAFFGGALPLVFEVEGGLGDGLLQAGCGW